MNDVQKIINDFKRTYCNVLVSSHQNSIKLWRAQGDGETMKTYLRTHELKKMLICYDLWNNGVHFYTELSLKFNILRPDIVAFFHERVVFIEIRDSESDDVSSSKIARLKEKFPNNNILWYFVGVDDDFNVSEIVKKLFEERQKELRL